MAKLRPTERPLPVDRPWKNRVLKRMADRGVTQADLHRATGMTTAMASLLFKQDDGGAELVKSTKWKLAIERWLEMDEVGSLAQSAISLPRDQDRQLVTRFAEILHELDEPARDALRSLIDPDDPETLRRVLALVVTLKR